MSVSIPAPVHNTGGPANARCLLQGIRRSQHADNLGLITTLLSGRKRPQPENARKAYQLGAERYRKLARWYPDQEALAVLKCLEQLGIQLGSQWDRKPAPAPARQIQTLLAAAWRWRLADQSVLRQVLSTHCNNRLSILLQQLSGCQSVELDSQRQALRKLLNLLHFLPCMPKFAASLPATDTASQALVALLKWQSAAARDSRTGALPAVQNQCDSIVGTLIVHCRQSDWSLEYFVRQGMARQCRCLLLLCGLFVGEDSSKRLARVCHALLTAHLGDGSPSAEQQQALVLALLSLQQKHGDSEQRSAVTVLTDASAPILHSSDNCGLIQSELELHLGRLRQGWQVFSRDAAGSSHVISGAEVLHRQPSAAYRDSLQAVLYSCYKLIWILQAMQVASLSQYCHCLLVVMQQYALLLRHLPPAVLLSLEFFCLQLAACYSSPENMHSKAPETDSAYICRLLQLLQLWPENPYLPLADIVPAHQNNGSPINSADELFRYLSARFITLLSVREDWFADRNTYLGHAGRLYAELSGLEQSAAVLRLPSLAALASKLLQTDCLLRLPCTLQSFPAALLFRSYQELARLLDCAAAWQPVLPDLQVQKNIHTWLAQAEESLHKLFAEESRKQGRCYLLLGIQRFAARLRQVLDHEIRIICEQGAELTFDDQYVALSHLEVLIRELLLQRRNLPTQNQSVSVSLRLTVEHEEQKLMLRLFAPDTLPEPQGRQLRRLLRKLDSAVGALSWQPAGQRQRVYCLSVSRLSGNSC